MPANQMLQLPTSIKYLRRVHKHTVYAVMKVWMLDDTDDIEIL